MSWRGRGEPPALRPSLLKICAGVVEEGVSEPYATALIAARSELDASFSDFTPEQRQALAAAIGLNLINRKAHPVELLCYTHQLPMGKKTFYLARRLFCSRLLRELHLLPPSA